MEKGNLVDKRKHPRVRVDCAVKFKVFTKGKGHEDFREAARADAEFGQAQDLSRRGILLYTAKPVKRADVLQLQFEPDVHGHPIEAFATVAWFKFHGKAGLYEVGLKILNLKKKDEALLDRLVAALKAKADPAPNAPGRAPSPRPRRGPKADPAALVRGERVVHQARVHWMVNKPAILSGLVVLAIGTATFESGGLLEGSLLFLLVALLLAASVEAWYLVKHSKFYVTNMRVIFKSGIFGKQFMEAHLSHIKRVAVEEHRAGRLLGYGDLVVTHRSGRRHLFKSVARPRAVAEKFREQLEANFD